jgi:uncharacterized protein
VPRFLVIVALWLALACAGLAETMPPKPAKYFNDLAGVITPATASQLDEKLRQFERDTSNQIVVAIFPRLETESSVQDFTYRIAESWGVGQKDRRNGAVLFVFIAERKMFIQVGYGLEGALPDALCKRIITEEIAPPFKAGYYDSGATAGVEAMIKATRGEYVGTGTAHGDGSEVDSLFFGIIVTLFLLIIVAQMATRWRRGTVYRSGGRGRGAGDGLFWTIVSAIGSANTRSSGGGRGSSSGGGFSGGGGSFGGGGAGGSW